MNAFVHLFDTLDERYGFDKAIEVIASVDINRLNGVDGYDYKGDLDWMVFV